MNEASVLRRPPHPPLPWISKGAQRGRDHEDGARHCSTELTWTERQKARVCVRVHVLINCNKKPGRAKHFPGQGESASRPRRNNLPSGFVAVDPQRWNADGCFQRRTRGLPRECLHNKTPSGCHRLDTLLLQKACQPCLKLGPAHYRNVNQVQDSFHSWGRGYVAFLAPGHAHDSHSLQSDEGGGGEGKFFVFLP